ncbi:Hypothetical predicted protein [Octopus vulgaris]|uniref:Uncharacterized protein n=1 Tax=Octopus vulgaris TaxID=6645 RepID=A0AA36BA45_OCTVU|nr:Hypothetical predicted protein [Octopus vulgaris]
MEVAGRGEGGGEKKALDEGGGVSEEKEELSFNFSDNFSHIANALRNDSIASYPDLLKLTVTFNRYTFVIALNGYRFSFHCVVVLSFLSCNAERMKEN